MTDLIERAREMAKLGPKWFKASTMPEFYKRTQALADIDLELCDELEAAHKVVEVARDLLAHSIVGDDLGGGIPDDEWEDLAPVEAALDAYDSVRGE